MTHVEVAEETVLLSLLGMLTFSYVLNRLQLFYYGKHARQLLRDLATVESRLQARGEEIAAAERDEIARWLGALERRLTKASQRLISWRSSSVEHWIIGKHLDPLLFDYERAGAMTMRLNALLARAGSAQRWVRPDRGRQEQAAVSARS